MAASVSTDFFDPGYLTRTYGNQELFTEKSKEAIAAGITFVQEKKSERVDPTQIFWSLYTLFARLRRQIAEEQNSKGKEKFGSIRSGDERKFHYFTAYTHLEHPHANYGKIALKRLAGIMNVMGVERWKGENKTQAELFQEVWGRRWSIKLEMLDPSPEGNFTLANGARFPDYIMRHVRGGELHITDKDDLIRFHQEERELYERTEMTMMIQTIERDYRSLNEFFAKLGLIPEIVKSDYVRTTLSMDIDGTYIPLAKFVTWIGKHHEGPLVDRMMGHSVAYVVHQDVAYHQITKVALSRLFAQIITWKERKGSLDELKSDIAHFRFILALLMPSIRGDGAIGNWFEQVAYNINDLVLEVPEKTLHPFEPFAAVLPQFYCKDYPKTRKIGDST